MKKPSTKASADFPASTLEQNALTHIAAKRYKEAAEIYKDLLKRWDTEFYRQQLAECYLQRALGMAAKAMPKEAAVLWENYAEWTKQPLTAVDTYILLLLAAKSTQKAYAKVKQLSAKDLDESFPELATWLGFLLVSGSADLAQHLPSDSALLTHWGLIKQALQAYQNQQPAQMDEALKQLPFRSAFRDLRALLKAQQTSAESIEQTQTLLSKIPAQSPYRPVADALLAYKQQGASFVASALNLDHTQRRIIARAKGLSNKQTELLDTLQKLQGKQTDKSQFNLAIQFQSLFDAETAQDFCQSKLADYPPGIKDYLKNFISYNGFEEHRIQALLIEKTDNSYDAIHYWRQCIKALQNNKNLENDRKTALILRHIADNVSKREAMGFTVESLDYDPEHKDSYLKVLAYYDKQNPNPDEYEHWLELSLKRFPKDIDLLARAAHSATDRKAFKKAAKYAQELLKIDPVNTLAKQLLFASHLAHARRLIKTKKFHLVDKEILAAEDISLDKSLRRQADLLRGFKIWAADDVKQGLQLIAEALQKLNDDPVNSQFQACIEASLLDASVTSILKALPPSKDHLLSAQQLTRLIALIKHYNEQFDSPKLLFEALDKIKAPLKKSLQQQDYSEDLLLTWCKALEVISHFELLKHTVKLAQAKSKKPIWLFYHEYAEIQGDPNRLNFPSMLRLQQAAEQARKENDQKTVHIIERFIEQSLGFQNPFYANFEDELFDSNADEMTTDLYDELFSQLPEKIINKIEQKVEATMLRMDPERYIAENMQKYGKRIDAKKLMNLFMNPDFFSAVALLNAADELNIDIGIRFEDIVYRFEKNNSPQMSLPFF